jgi:hypothetical protein
MEIQREIEELMARKDDVAIENKIKSFDLCTQEDNVTKKRAGLYGISVVTVALYQKVRIRGLNLRNRTTTCNSS